MGTKDPANKPLVAGDMEEYVAMQANRKSKNKKSATKGAVFGCLKTIFSRLYPARVKRTWTA